MSLQKLKAIYNEAYYTHLSEGSERSAEALAKAKKDLEDFKTNSSEKEKSSTKKESSKKAEPSKHEESSKQVETLKDEESSKQDNPSEEEEAIALHQEETKKK